jgi:hypothetical protein
MKIFMQEDQPRHFGEKGTGEPRDAKVSRVVREGDNGKGL